MEDNFFSINKLTKSVGEPDQKNMLNIIEMNIFSNSPLAVSLDSIKTDITILVGKVDRKFVELRFDVDCNAKGNIKSISWKDDDDTILYYDYDKSKIVRSEILSKMKSHQVLKAESGVKSAIKNDSTVTTTKTKTTKTKTTKTKPSPKSTNLESGLKTSQKRKTTTVVGEEDDSRKKVLKVKEDCKNYIGKYYKQSTALSTPALAEAVSNCQQSSTLSDVVVVEKLSGSSTQSTPLSAQVVEVVSSCCKSTTSNVVLDQLSSPQSPAFSTQSTAVSAAHSSCLSSKVADKYVSISEAFPYQIFKGGDYAANEVILREQFQKSFQSTITIASNNKLVALESVFYFMLTRKVDFKGYMELLEETCIIARNFHLNNLEEKFKSDTHMKHLKDNEKTNEVGKTYQHMNSYTHEIFCNVIRFLKNCNEYLRNGCPTALSFGYSFVIEIEKVKSFLIPDVMSALRSSVTREDELSVRLLVAGFRKIRLPLLECLIQEQYWELFREPEKHKTAICELFASLGHKDVDIKLIDPRLVIGLKEYFSPKNPFRSVNPELSKYLEMTTKDTTTITTTKKKKSDGYGSLLTEHPTPVKKPKNNKPKKSSTNEQLLSKFLSRDENIFDYCDDSEFNSVCEDADKAMKKVNNDPLSGFKSDFTNQHWDAQTRDDDDNYYADKEITSMANRKLNVGTMSDKDRLAIMLSQWKELKKAIIDHDTVAIVDNAISMLDNVLRITGVDDKVEMMEEKYDISMISTDDTDVELSFDSTSLQTSFKPQKKFNDRSKSTNVVDLSTDNSKVKSLNATVTNATKAFLDAQFTHEGLLAPQPYFGQSTEALDEFVCRIHSCTMVVYLRILAGLFYHAEQLICGGSEEYHYNNLITLQKTTPQGMEYYYKTSILSSNPHSEENNGDPFMQALNLIKVSQVQKLYLKIKQSVLKDKNCFLQNLRTEFNQNKLRKKNDKIIQDYSILYLAFDVQDIKQDQSSHHVPLHADIDSKTLSSKSTGIRIGFKYSLCAVMYLGDNGDIVFRVLAAMKDINMFQHSVFDVFPASLLKDTVSVCFSSSILPSSITEKIANEHAFPATFSSGVDSFAAIGSFWYRTESSATYNIEKPSIECLPATSYVVEGVHIGNDILMNRLVKAKGWLTSNLIEIFCIKSLKYFNNSNNILSSYLFEKLFLEDSYNYETVKKYNSECYKNGQSLFDEKNILHIPINYPTNSHWQYCYVLMGKKCIVLADSLNNEGGNGDKITKIILRYLKDEFEANNPKMTVFDNQKWSCFYEHSTPHQVDGYNCGVFLILNMLRVLQYVHCGKKFIKSQSPNSRTRLLGSEWKRTFSEEEKIELRLTMFEIIRNDSDVRALLPFIVGDGEANVHGGAGTAEALSRDETAAVGDQANGGAGNAEALSREEVEEDQANGGAGTAEALSREEVEEDQANGGAGTAEALSREETAAVGDQANGGAGTAEALSREETSTAKAAEVGRRSQRGKKQKNG